MAKIDKETIVMMQSQNKWNGRVRVRLVGVCEIHYGPRLHFLRWVAARRRTD